MYVHVKNLHKSYRQGDDSVEVLQGIDFSMEQGEMCVLLGPSGSGKSTLLNVIGGLDTIDGGEVTVGDISLAGKSAKELSLYRRHTLGYIFQFYNLIPNLTVRENIQLCGYLTKEPMDMEELLAVLGLSEHGDKFPAQLSGGQQQRVAIARAVIKNPGLLLCDEPTGALDSKTSREILILLETINQKYHTTILLVTHNEVIQDMVHQVLRLKDGKIISCHRNETLKPAAALEL